MKALLALLYPVALVAGWLGLMWFLMIPPVLVFLGFNLQNAAIAERMRRTLGVGDEEVGQFLREAGRPILPIALWNGVLYSVAFFITFGIHKLF